LDAASSVERFSCREENPATGELEYFDPLIGCFGTREAMGQLALVIDEPTPKA